MWNGPWVDLPHRWCLDTDGDVGMGVTHAWELYGDSEPPDIQVIGKGLGGGSVATNSLTLRFSVFLTRAPHWQVCLYRCGSNV